MRSSALADAVVRDLCSGQHLSGRTQLFGLLLNVACRLHTPFHTIPNSRTCAGPELRLALDRPLSNMPSWGDRALTGAGRSLCSGVGQSACSTFAWDQAASSEQRKATDMV